MAALIVSFSLDALRHGYGHLVPAGADPRHDTAPFRAFRERLLAAVAAAARAPADLAFWWEGTYNGYSLCVSVAPPEAVPDAGRAAEAACEADDVRVAEPRSARYPLAHVEPGTSQVARDADGALFEAPFGAPAGHFGAPGVRRIG